MGARPERPLGTYLERRRQGSTHPGLRPGGNSGLGAETTPARAGRSTGAPRGGEEAKDQKKNEARHRRVPKQLSHSRWSEFGNPGTIPALRCSRSPVPDPAAVPARPFLIPGPGPDPPCFVRCPYPCLPALSPLVPPR